MFCLVIRSNLIKKSGVSDFEGKSLSRADGADVKWTEDMSNQYFLYFVICVVISVIYVLAFELYSFSYTSIVKSLMEILFSVREVFRIHC